MSFTDIVTFGDSFSDNGNQFALTGRPKPPYFQGRFSNGPVWIEDLSARLGAKLHDYAFGGGVISTADVPMGSASGLAMEEQLKNYTTTKMFPSASTLYTVFCGGNDFLDNLGVSVKTGTLPNGTQISAQMTTFLSHLVANAHATNILLLNLPPMEDTPILLQNASSFASVIAPMSVAYNQEVDAGVKGIVAANPGVNVMTFDFYAFVKDLVTSPTVFTVVNASCMDPMTNAVCSDPDSYLFFDYLHPTARAHSYLANATYDFLTSSTASAAASSVGLAQIAAAVVPMAGGEPVSTLTPSPSSFSGTSANASSASLKVQIKVAVHSQSTHLPHPSPTPIAMFTDVVAFGDSFSDNGNALAMFGIPKPPYFQGRFSNGPVWVEHLADRLGAKLHDLAVEGGVISDADIPKDALPASDLAMQLKNYTQKVLDPATTLYTVFCGGNDFIDNMPVALKTGVLPNVTMISGDMVAFLSDLVKANATNILLMNLPPIEASPLVIQSIGPFAPIVAKLPVQYNQQVAAGVQAIAAANAGLKLQTFDFYALVKNLIADTALFPIVNRSCLVNTTACSDPDSYLFWDHLHPTAKAHSLLANATYDFLMTGVEPTVSSTVPATTAAVVVTAAVATTSKAVTTTTAKSSASRAGLWSGRVVGVAVVSVLLQLLL